MRKLKNTVRFGCVFTAILSLSEFSFADSKHSQGRALLLENCPGYTTTITLDDNTQELFGVAVALLTPLLKFGVSAITKGLGDKFSADAKVANIDQVHTGDYLFKIAETKEGKGFQLRSRCLIVFSKGIITEKRDNSEFGKKYKTRIRTINPNPKSFYKKFNDSWSQNNSILSETLDQYFVDKTKPALLGIFEVEVSDSSANFRLIPRYVYSDHSIRDKKRDGNSRTYTFEIEMRSPGAEKPFGKSTIVFQGIVNGSPFTQYSQKEVLITDDSGHVEVLKVDSPSVVSDWMNIPTASSPKKTKLEAFISATAKKNSAYTSMTLSGAAAVKLGDTKISKILLSGETCASVPEINAGKISTNSNLVIEELRTPKNSKSIARYTNAKTFYNNCLVWHSQEKLLNNSLQLLSGEPANPYDLTVTMKEFRKKPFVKFLGDALSDETTRKSLNGTIVSAIDPGTRNAAQLTSEAAKEAALFAFETALIDSEKAILAYNQSITENDKAVKYIDMEQKKRVANRKAISAGIDLPYPESGVWLHLQ